MRIRIIFLAIVFIVSCKHEPKASNTLPAGATSIIYSSYIIVPGYINNAKGNFILDSGAEGLHLDDIFTNENLPPFINLKKVRLTGIGNSFSTATLIKDTVIFKFHKDSFNATNILIHSLKPIGGDFLDGLIGLRFFPGTVLEINYKQQYIKFYSSIDSADLSGFNLIPMKIIEGRLCIPVNVLINEKVSFNGNFMIDLGSPGSSVTSSASQKFKLTENITRKIAYSSKYAGVGGYSYGYDFIADSLEISNVALKNVNMSFSSDTTGVLSSDNFSGIIGNNILDRFSVILDFKNYNLYLNPNEQFLVPYEPDRLGFTYVERVKTTGGWIVAGLNLGSPAHKNGLSVDDKIISVNNIPVKEIPYNKIDEFLNKLDRIELVVKRVDSTINIKFNLVPVI